MTSIKLSAIVYSGSSIIIGPTIIFYALGRGRVGMDCSDSTWFGVSETIKASYYSDATMIMVAGSVAMLAIGGFLLYSLRKQPRSRSNLIDAWFVGLMMLGYVLILASAGSWNC